jgi:hypothetical protein
MYGNSGQISSSAREPAALALFIPFPDRFYLFQVKNHPPFVIPAKAGIQFFSG